MGQEEFSSRTEPKYNKGLKIETEAQAKTLTGLTDRDRLLLKMEGKERREGSV